MNDRECLELLTWAMPRLGLRWRGFKNLRRQVCRRIVARASMLGVTTADAYRSIVERDPEELRRLDAMCFVTISRFYRDAPTFDALRMRLPLLAASALARGERTFRVWSAGCASGEEPYTIAMLWAHDLAARFPALTLDVLATDFDETVLARAARATTYEPSSLVELPAELRALGFDGHTVREEVRRHVRFERHDIRRFAPAEAQHVVLCRSSVFTYLDDAKQRDFLARVRLAPDGILVRGKGERLPMMDLPFTTL